MPIRCHDFVRSIVGSIFISIFLSLSACRPPSDPANPLPVSTILKNLEDATRRIKDFKGGANIAAYINDRRGRVGARIQYLAPDRYRIDIQGGFMQIMAVLLIEDQNVLLYTPRENTLFEGALHDHEVVVPGLRISLIDMRTAALGLIDLQPYVEGPITEYRYENGQALISIRQAGRTRTIWVDPRKSVVIKEEERQGDEISVTRTFEQYNKRKGIWRPGRIKIRSDVREESMDLVYYTQSVNGGLTRADLTVRFPDSVIRRPLREIMISR